MGAGAEAGGHQGDMRMTSLMTVNYKAVVTWGKEEEEEVAVAGSIPGI